VSQSDSGKKPNNRKKRFKVKITTRIVPKEENQLELDLPTSKEPIKKKRKPEVKSISADMTLVPNHLREMMPDSAMRMEAAVLIDQLRKMRIAYKPRHFAKRVEFRVPMERNFMLSISPVDVGVSGYKQYTSYRHVAVKIPDGTYQVRPKESIRANLVITNTCDPAEEQIVSITVSASDLPELIQQAIHAFYKTGGFEIAPLERT
jgi:hypothetical protein